MKTKPIKQDDDKSCMAACAAMITGTTLNEVRAAISEHPRGGYDDKEINKYLMQHGYMLGGMWLSLDHPWNLTADRLQFSLPMDTPMLLAVKSERLPGQLHAIYWDGEHLFDPNPKVDNAQRVLADYDVRHVAFVQQLGTDRENKAGHIKFKLYTIAGRKNGNEFKWDDIPCDADTAIRFDALTAMGCCVTVDVLYSGQLTISIEDAYGLPVRSETVVPRVMAQVMRKMVSP